MPKIALKVTPKISRTSKGVPFGKKTIEKAVRISSALEGLSLARAKKDKAAISLLKKHGRAFSI